MTASEPPIRAVIVDDEEPARELLRALLGRWPNVTIVGEAGDGRTALALVADARPDLAFLDVQMPGMSGTDVAAALSRSGAPLVVFVTAYDQYAVRAFELSACDYLLKPFDAGRLGATMERVAARLRGEPHDAGAAVRELLRRLTRPEPIVVKLDGRHLFLDAAEIEWIEAVGKDARVHLAAPAGTAPLVTRESMNSLEARLDPATFLRVHRSAIVNRRHIRELQPWFKGDYVVILRRGARVTTGRTYRDAVRRLIAEPDR